MDKLRALNLAMLDYMQGDARRIQHFTKVHAYARLLGQEEGLDKITQSNLESAALLHDIGIREAERKFGYNNGKLQEQEGPAEAVKLLQKLPYTQAEIDRITYLIGHHHTYDQINGPDYQILVEADFLVNLYEDQAGKDAIAAAAAKIFKTASGKKLLACMFGQKA